MSEYIVEMKHITKRFPGIVANDDVTIQIKKGEIFALLGENGAGKSTLMSMLFGMYEPDEGEIYIRGEKVKLESPNHATKLNIGMVHQHFKLVSNYTIAENIVMGMEPVKKVLGCIPVVDMKKANQDIRNLSEKYGLAVNPTDVISDINVSTQQRVEILKMLYREAEILIFDEPTAVLTPQEIDFLLDIIKSLRDDGKTIILITHKLEEIKRIADRCAILNRGRLMDVMDVATTSTKVMANKMVGREVNFETEKEPAKRIKIKRSLVIFPFCRLLIVFCYIQLVYKLLRSGIIFKDSRHYRNHGSGSSVQSDGPPTGSFYSVIYYSCSIFILLILFKPDFFCDPGLS